MLGKRQGYKGRMRTCLRVLAMATLVLGEERRHEIPECGDEWHLFGAHCYHVEGVQATHAHATVLCKAHESHLVSVHSTTENDYLLSLLEGVDGLWLGLEAGEEYEEVEEEELEEEKDGWSIERLDRERSWRWADGSSLTYTSWATLGSLPESAPRCVSLDTRTALWLPTPCHHTLKVICKKSCHHCQPQPPATLLTGDADGSGSGDAADLLSQFPSRTYQSTQPLRPPEGEAAREVQGTPRPANIPACEGACGRTFYRLSTTPRTWQQAREDCLAGKGRVARLINRVPPKLAQRLAELGTPLWVGSRPDDTFTPPRPGQLIIGVVRSWAPCRVAMPGASRTTTVTCLRRHHYLCEYSYGSEDNPRPSAAVLAAPATPRTPCAADWQLSGGRCYRAFAAWVSWAAAQYTCEGHGGHLVSVGDASELRSLRRLSLGRIVTSPVWIGLRRTEGAAEGFEWVDGTPYHLQGWERGQPDHHQGREGCGAASLPTFALQDAMCLALLPFVCEADAGMPEATLPPLASLTLPDELCDGDNAWTRFGHHCYRLVGAEDPQPWWESHERCLEEGATLASVHSLQENYWLQAKLLRLSAGVVWLGGRVGKEGYRWLDHTPFNFTNWAPGEPNNVHDQEDCLSLYSRRQGYWNDQNCGTPAGRVCKRSLGRSHHSHALTPAAPSPPTASLRCPQTWITAPGGKCYKYFGELEDFDGARAACRRESPAADLASVHTAAQQAYLTVMAGVGGMGTWLGMKKQENHYLWVDQTPVTLTSWAAGEPSGAKASLLGRRRQKAEECVETLTHSRAGQWNDVACSERRAFVCQAPMEAQTEAQTGPSPSPAGPSCAPSDPLYLRTGNHCYHYVLTPRPWQEAEDTCALEGAHLATALTRTEAAAVWVVAMEARLEEAWLGLRHEQEHGAFRWSSGWPLLHAPWSPHTNTSEGEGMCAAVSSSSGQWVARPCLTARPFICHLANDVSGVSERASRGSCPDGRWLDFGGANCYLVVREPRPWHDARYSCVLEGGDLTSIASAAEMSLVTLTVHDLTQAVWIGLVREANGQRWTDGMRVTFTNWNDGEPNGGAGLCTEVYTRTGRWNDVQCSQVRPFVCKHLRS